jgi:hypothetical protein
MKHKLPYLFFAIFLIAQFGYSQQPVLPLSPNASPLFGKDIIINDQPGQIQSQVALCSAFNGWLYAAIAYTNGWWGNVGSFTILKSVDNGITWDELVDGFYGLEGSKVISLDLIAVGNSTSSIKVLISMVVSYGSLLYGDSFVRIYDGSTGEFLDQLYNSSSTYDIALASDLMFPAENSNPFSVGILFSRYRYNGGNDSILFISSGNGGVSIDKKIEVAGSASNFHKVALKYGRCSSFPSGRYFAAWEEQNGFGDQPGHLYYSHSEPFFNSPFVKQICIDSLDPALINKVRNPSIACQNSSFDNDSSNLSLVVICEKQDETNNKNDIHACYNVQAASHSIFHKMNLSDSMNNNMQPDIAFDSYDSTFRVTYYNSSLQKLPFLYKNYNLNEPNEWGILSDGYNDKTDLFTPYPKIEISSDLKSGANAWISNMDETNGTALFDSPASTWTKIIEPNKFNEAIIAVYPNPCTYQVNVTCQIPKPERVTLSLVNIYGQNLIEETKLYNSKGVYVNKLDISKYANGVYVVVVNIENEIYTNKILINKGHD